MDLSFSCIRLFFNAHFMVIGAALFGRGVWKVHHDFYPTDKYPHEDLCVSSSLCSSSCCFICLSSVL